MRVLAGREDEEEEEEVRSGVPRANEIRAHACIWTDRPTHKFVRACQKKPNKQQQHPPNVASSGKKKNSYQSCSNFARD